MTLFLPVERATLLIPSGIPQDPHRLHLFILLNNPVTAEQWVLLVSLSSIKAGRPYDATCVIDPNETDHEFIKKPSFIDYSKTRLEPATKLMKGVTSGVLIPKGTIEREIFERILQGVSASPRTPLKYKQFYQTHLIAP